MQHWFGPTTRQGVVMLDRIVNEQAQIVAYANDYLLLIIATVPAWLLLLLVRLPRKAIGTPVR
jgi:DHA2 family multidrug resistance protein